MTALADLQPSIPATLRAPVPGSVPDPFPDQADVARTPRLVAPRPGVLTRPGAPRGLLAVADAACALVAAMLATTAASPAASLGTPPTPVLVPAIGLPVLWVTLIAFNHGYGSRLVPVGSEDLGRVIRTGIQLPVVGAALAWALDWSTPRAELVTVVAVTTGLSLGHRMVGSAVSRRLRLRGVTPTRRVVVAGHPHQANLVTTELARSRACGLEVAGVCLPHPDAPDSTPRPGSGSPLATGFDRLLALVRQQAADAVIVLPCDHLTPQDLRRLTWDLEDVDAQLFVAPGVLDVNRSRSTITHAGGMPMMHIRAAQLRGVRHLAKALTERLLALVVLLLLAPVLLTLMLAVRLDSAGSPLFRQRRVGRDGTPFTMLKLRTMTDGAERQVVALADRNESDGVLFKVRADPRVTRLGRVLRRYSLDELPQLVNVVRGDMSLVGPRPALPEEVARYEPDVHRRLAVRPGVTGLWQVSGRSNLSWEDSVRLDLAYVDNWSLWADVKILLRTGRAVFSHAGAY